MPLAFKDGPTRTEPHSGIVRLVTGTIRSKEAASWCEAFTSTEVEKLQSQDSELQIIRSWLIHGVDHTQHELPIFSATCKYYWAHRVHFVMQDGNMYHKGAEYSSTRYLLLAPYSMRDRLLDACHGHITASHTSESKTLTLLQRKFYWRGMLKACKLFVTSCVTCSMNKDRARHLRASLGIFFTKVSAYQQDIYLWGLQHQPANSAFQ